MIILKLAATGVRRWRKRVANLLYQNRINLSYSRFSCKNVCCKATSDAGSVWAANSVICGYAAVLPWPAVASRQFAAMLQGALGYGWHRQLWAPLQQATAIGQWPPGQLAAPYGR